MKRHDRQEDKMKNVNMFILMQIITQYSRFAIIMLIIDKNHIKKNNDYKAINILYVFDLQV